MDPNANLEEQRKLVADLNQLQTAWGSTDDSEHHAGLIADKALRLAELVEALDEWLVKGGFLPTAWARP